MSEGPAIPLIGAIGAIASAGSAVMGLTQAFQKPPSEGPPKTPQAVEEQRRRQASGAMYGRAQTQVAGQRLGQPGGGGGGFV